MHIVFAGCLTLLGRVLGEGVVTYGLGGWSAPFGIEYRIDALNALFLVTVSGVAALVTISGRLTAAEQIGRQRMGHFLRQRKEAVRQPDRFHASGRTHFNDFRTPA